MSDSQSNAMEYPATIHVRSKLRLFQLFKDRLNEDRRTLFKTTCFGPWLDIIYVENDDGMIHYVLQKQCCSDDDNFDLPLIYHVNGHSLHFGRREFCLLTGFEFGSISFREYRNGDIPFRNRLFPEKIGYDVKIIDLFALFDDEEKFSKLSDEDAIRLCLLLSLEVIFMGRELVSVVDDVYLRMVNDLDAWNSFPWGEHIWRQLYDSIRNVSSKHKLEHLAGLKRNPNHVPSYSLTGFLFAFKIWIIESSCVSDRWWTKVPEIIFVIISRMCFVREVISPIKVLSFGLLDVRPVWGVTDWMQSKVMRTREVKIVGALTRQDTADVEGETGRRLRDFSYHK
ncbi:phospholipase-like, aminotransferase-like mobile domain protein [Tanacetum coccineum]